MYVREVVPLVLNLYKCFQPFYRKFINNFMLLAVSTHLTVVCDINFCNFLEDIQ